MAYDLARYGYECSWQSTWTWTWPGMVIFMVAHLARYWPGMVMFVI